MHRPTRTAWQVVTAFWTLGAVGCTHASTAPAQAPRFVVTPPVWVTDAPELTAPLTPEVQAGFEAEGLATDALSDAPTAECAEDVACLADAGRTASADRLVVPRLARLGPTTLLRLQSIDVPAAAMEHTLQSVIEDTDDARLARSLRDSSQRLARLYAPAPPWYRRPMVIAAGAVVVVAATVAVVLLTRGDGTEPDITVIPR